MNLAKIHWGSRYVNGLVDPGGDREGLDLRGFSDEAFWVDEESGVEDGLALSQGVLSEAVVDIVRGQHGDPGMVMMVVVVVEEIQAEGAGILERAKMSGELGAVFEGFEVSLGVGIVGAGEGA